MNEENPNIRIRNWYYDLILAEEKTKQNLRRGSKYHRIQKLRDLFLFMLKEIPLTFPVVGLSYGAVIQIVSPEMPMRTLFKVEAKQGIALGGHISFKVISKRQTFANGDKAIGTALLTPCSRNVWTLVPEDPSKKGKELRYGDSFYIQIYNSDPPLYLEAMTLPPSIPKGECGHVIPTLVRNRSYLTRFEVVHVNPPARYETEGMVVPAFEPVAIIQGASHKSLAVEPDAWFPTYFGMECEVSIHTYTDQTQKSKPDPRNFWSLRLSS